MKQQSRDETAIVVFDLDGTITRYDTYVRFLLYVIARKPLKLARLPLLSIDVLRHKLGSQTNSWLKKRFLSALLAGHDQQTINAWALLFFPECHFLRTLQRRASVCETTSGERC